MGGKTRRRDKCIEKRLNQFEENFAKINHNKIHMEIPENVHNMDKI